MLKHKMCILLPIWFTTHTHMYTYSLTKVKYTPTHTTYRYMSTINRSCLDVREQETTHTRVVFPPHLHIKTRVYFYFDEAVTFFLTLPLVVSSQAKSKNESCFKGYICIYEYAIIRVSFKCVTHTVWQTLFLTPSNSCLYPVQSSFSEQLYLYF